MPIDVNLIRGEKEGSAVDAVRASEKKRHGSKPPALDTVDEAIRLDMEWRKQLQALELVREEKNKVVAEVSASKNKAPTQEQRDRSKQLSASIAALELELSRAANLRDEAILRIGNVLHESVPNFEREEDFEMCVTSSGEFVHKPELKSHHQALWMLGAYEPERGSSVAGHRGYYLKGVGVLLNSALVNYALDFLMQKEFDPVQPPYFMTKQAMKKVSQLSDFEESLYHLEAKEDSKDKGEDYFLIATSEQPMCCFHQNETLNASELPLRYAGYSPCFRKEAGKFGVDTWGIFRVHQFDKVEQFVVCEPNEEASYACLEQLRQNAEEFLQSLELPFKTINVVSGELNLAAAKKYDINAWFPSLNAHKELVSASNCLDYQSRATDTFTMVDGKKVPVHLLNATLCAVTRTICCIVENHQGSRQIIRVNSETGEEETVTEHGVHVPKALLPYMRGRAFLPFVREERDFAQQRPANKTEARKKGQDKQQQQQPKEKKPSTPAAAVTSPKEKKLEKKSVVEKPNVQVVEEKPLPQAPKSEFSYSVSGEEFSTNIVLLNGKQFDSVASYVAFLNNKQ